MNTPPKLSRRLLLKATGAGVAVAFTARLTQADDKPPMLEEDDSIAEAVDYVSDSGSLSDRCGFCDKYTGHPNDDAGPCAVFPDNSVMANGVCSEFISVPQ